MRSPLRALVWEQTKPILPAMLAVALACVLFNALPQLCALAGGHWQAFPETSQWFAIGAVTAFFLVMLLTSADPNDLRPRFGARLYRLPVGTGTLVTTLFVLRILLVTIEVVAILSIQTWWFGGRVAQRGPDDFLLTVPTVGALVATYAVLQAVGWSVGNASTKAAVTLGLLLIAAYVGGLVLMDRWELRYASLQGFRFLPAWFCETLRFAEYHLHRVTGLAVCLAGSYAAIYAGVALDRRGWFQSALALPGFGATSSSSRVWSARRFTSPAAAQRWFEWRRMGLLLPSGVLMILAMSVLIPTVLASASSSGVRWNGRYVNNLFVFQAGALFLGTVLAGLVLVVLDRHDQRSGLARFIAARPLSTWGVARARFEAAFLSVLLTITALAVLSLGWTLVAAPTHKVLTLWFTYPTYSVMRVATYCFWAIFLWGILLIAMTPASVLARKGVALIGVLDLAVLVALEIARAYEGFLACLALTLIAGTVFLLYRPAYRSGLVGPETVWMGIMGWSVLFVLYTAILIPGSGTFDSAAPGDYLLAAALCTIPVVPLAGVPLAVHRWRHNQTGRKGWML